MKRAAKVVLIIAQCIATQCIMSAPLVSQMSRTDDRRWSVALAVGVERSTRRDGTISPLRFAGQGLMGWLEITRTSLFNEFHLALSGNSAKLVSNATTSNELLSNGSVTFDGLHTLLNRQRFWMRAGLDAGISYDDTFHRFAFDGVAPTTYRLAMVTGGAALAVEERGEWGVLTIRAAVPVIGFVDHPYSDLKNGYSTLHPVFVSVNRLRQMDADGSYTTNNKQPLHVRVSVHTMLLSYRDEQAVHGLLNSIAAGFVLQQRARQR